jgi:hypothetical protein
MMPASEAEVSPVKLFTAEMQHFQVPSPISLLRKSSALPHRRHHAQLLGAGRRNASQRVPRAPRHSAGRKEFRLRDSQPDERAGGIARPRLAQSSARRPVETRDATCPSCHQKRTLLTAIHVAEAVCSCVAHRQVVLTIPKRLRLLARVGQCIPRPVCQCVARVGVCAVKGVLILAGANPAR